MNILKAEILHQFSSVDETRLDTLLAEEIADSPVKPVTPAFIIAKGGITSSDIAVRALGIKKARVMGQIRPSVPVWQTGEESRFPLTPYVIFPGNTGTEKTLREAVEILAGKE